MSAQKTTPRPYLGAEHLTTTVPTHGGAIAVHPVSAMRIRFDVAMSAHLPLMRDAGEDGSRVLEIEPGVKVRASGFVVRVGGAWEMEAAYLDACRADGGTLSNRQKAIAEAVIRDAMNAWTETHAADIAQAGDIWRNNRARDVEVDIARLENTLEELRAQLYAIENPDDTQEG